MFKLGHWELVVILAVVVLLFGNRIPGVARSLGKAVSSFKKGLSDTDNQETG